MLREARGGLKVTGNRVTTRQSLYPHIVFVLLCFFQQKFCWQQLLGLLHNITASLKSIRPHKTEIKIIAEKIGILGESKTKYTRVMMNYKKVTNALI